MCPQYIPLMLEMWHKLYRALQLLRERKRNTSEVEEAWQRHRQAEEEMLCVCLSQHFAMNGCWGIHGNNTAAASLVGRYPWEIFYIFSLCIILLFFLSEHACDSTIFYKDRWTNTSTWMCPNASTSFFVIFLCEACHLYTTSDTVWNFKNIVFQTGFLVRQTDRPVKPIKMRYFKRKKPIPFNFEKYFCVGLIWVIVEHLIYV